MSNIIAALHCKVTSTPLGAVAFPPLINMSKLIIVLSDTLHKSSETKQKNEYPWINLNGFRIQYCTKLEFQILEDRTGV